MNEQISFLRHFVRSLNPNGIYDRIEYIISFVSDIVVVLCFILPMNIVNVKINLLLLYLKIKQYSSYI